MREPLKLVLFKTANIDFGFSLLGSGVAVAFGVGFGVFSFRAGDLVGSTVGPSVGIADALGCGVGDSFFAKRSSLLLVNNHATRMAATASTTTIPKIQGKALFRFDSRSETPAR
jgi:hypothetical protein